MLVALQLENQVREEFSHGQLEGTPQWRVGETITKRSGFESPGGRSGLPASLEEAFGPRLFSCCRERTGGGPRRWIDIHVVGSCSGRGIW